MVKPQVNHIKSDIEKLSIYLRSTKKFGKSTLFRDVIIEKYGDPTKGLLVQCGRERGTKMLDNVNTLHIGTYKEFIELVDWLINEQGKEHDIHMVAFDTVDELIPLVENEVVRQYNADNPQKKVKTINGAHGGYQNGQGEAAKIIKKHTDRLQESGFGVWGIAHTKFKTIKDKGSLEEDGYMQLTSNLIAPYESAFGDIFDVTLTGVIDRQLEDRVIEKDDKTVVKHYSTDTVRKLYFRGTPMIDAGGRFAYGSVPEYLVFDKPNMAKDFIRVVEEGMEKSKTLTDNPTYENDNLPEETDTEKLTVDFDEIRAKFKNADIETKKEVKKILNEKGNGKLDSTLSEDVINEILNLLD